VLLGVFPKTLRKERFTVNENVENYIELHIDEILSMACGRDEAGMPNSTAVLAVNRIESADKGHTLSQIIISNADFQLYISGGAATIQIDFKKPETFEYKRAITICSEWMQNLDNPEFDNLHLSLTVVPTILYGEIFLMFTNLVYFTGIPTDDGNRLVLVFDNNASEVFNTDEIDYQALTAAVELEMRQEEEELENQALAIQQELEEARQVNPYADAVQERMRDAANGLMSDEEDDEDDGEDDDSDPDDENPTTQFRFTI
jgi:hypothetical protein